MSTPPSPPVLDAPRQLSVPLPPEFDRAWVHFASSATHAALGSVNCVRLYSLPAFDLVDMINPGKLSRNIVEPLRIHERILVVICDRNQKLCVTVIHRWTQIITVPEGEFIGITGRGRVCIKLPSAHILLGVVSEEKRNSHLMCVNSSVKASSDSRYSGWMAFWIALGTG